MIYDLSTKEGYEQAKDFLNGIQRLGKRIKIERVNESRSLSQNAYLHVILTAFGMHFGYDKAEAKEVYKDVNKELYYYKKKDRLFKKSSADLTKEEMMRSIDLFMQKSAEQGCPLPQAHEKGWLEQIANQAEKEHYK